MLTEIIYTNMEPAIVAKPKVACAKCKRSHDPGEMSRCALCTRHACDRCTVKRYGKKFCSARCMFCFGLEDEE